MARRTVAGPMRSDSEPSEAVTPPSDPASEPADLAGELERANKLSEDASERAKPISEAPHPDAPDRARATPPSEIASAADDNPIDRGVRRPLPPMITYAQNFEDVLLRRALSEIEQGFYVDVGAFHPVTDSVTCWFYSQGWSGINVEPNPRFHALLREARPHDLNLAAAAAGTTGEIELHLLDGLSTTVETVAEQHARTGRASEGTTRVMALSLSDLFARHVGTRTVDFLKIDVEGAEAAILDACPFDTVRPRLIVVEATEPDSVAQSAAAWEPGLIAKSYLFCYFDGLNRYYVRTEDAWRQALFDAPPNVFDAFRLAFTDDRVDYVASARTVLDQIPEGGIAALIADRDRMRSERDTWSKEAQARLAERDTWSKEAQARLAERDQLAEARRADQIAHEFVLRRERGIFAQEIASLARDLEADQAAKAVAHATERAAQDQAHAAERAAQDQAHASERAAQDRAHAAERAEQAEMHARLLAELEAQRAALAAELATSTADHSETLARLEASERRAEALAAARDVSVLAGARLQIKLDALRLSGLH